MAFWNNLFSRDTSTPLRAAVSAEREQRSTGVTVSTEETDGRLLALLGLGGGAAVGGVAVNERNALGFAAVWACVLAIGQDIAALPCHLYADTPTGKQKVAGHPAGRLLNLQASPLQNAMPHRLAMVVTVLLHGNAYARIEFDTPGYSPRALHYKHPRQTEVIKSGGKLYYRFWGDAKVYQDYEVIHLRGLCLDDNGVMGLSVLAAHRENLGTGLAAQRGGARFYENGAKVAGALETDKQLSQDAADRLRKNFGAIYGGADNAGKVVVLEEGLKFKTISLPPADAQFLDTRKFTAREVASIFRVPAHKMGDLERSTNNNIEQQGIDYVQNCLQPWVVAIEQEYRLKLLRTREQETHYFRHNLAALLRADATGRGNFYAKLFSVGALSPNEIRELEEMNPADGGDRRFVQVNMMPLDKVDAILASRNPPAAPAPTPEPTDD